MGVSIEQINRGGDVTYHGPGQVVGYPIINLKHYGKDVHYFVDRIENTFIKLLREDYGITAASGEKTYTGVWVGKENNRHWNSGKTLDNYAWFCLNVNTDLSHFSWIVPCGLTDAGVTSIQKITGQEQDMQKLFKRTAEVFCDSFGAKPNFVESNFLEGNYE